MIKVRKTGGIPPGEVLKLKNTQVAEGVRFLDSVQLEMLTRCFESWLANTSGASTRRARGRVYLTFLVLRMTGAKLGETLALDDQKDIDFEQSTVTFIDDQGSHREVQLPWEVIKEILTFARDPWNEKLLGSIFKMDQGHVRRKFQEVCALCGLPKELSNPTVLRRSRAIELLRGGIPVKVVQNILGITTSNLVANFLDFSSDEMKQIVEHQITKETSRKTSARNTFFGKVTGIRKGDIQSEVELTTLGGFEVISVITNGSLKNMGLSVGSYATAIVKAPWVIIGKSDLATATSTRNKFSGTISKVLKGQITDEVTVTLKDGTQICSILTDRSMDNLQIGEGDVVDVMFKSSSVILLIE